MTSGWARLFHSLDAQSPGLIARWMMKNGAIFDMTVPESSDVLEETFSASIEFPFEFREIEQLVFPDYVGPTAWAIRNDLGSIRSILAKSNEFDWQDDAERIVIKPRLPG